MMSLFFVFFILLDSTFGADLQKIAFQKLSDKFLVVS